MPSSITGISQALTPGIRIRFDNSLAFNGSSAVPKVLLALGPLLTGGTATAGVPVRVSSAADAHTKFGAGSSTAIMLAKAFDAAQNVEMWGLGIAETGAFATGTLVLSGTAGAGDTVSVEVGGERVVIPLPVGDVNLSAASIATSLNNYTNLPVSFAAGVAAVATKTLTITFTAKNPGPAGWIDVRKSPDLEQPAGISVTITAMNSVTTSAPDLTGLESALTEQWWNTIVMPWSDTVSMDAIKAAAKRRWENIFKPTHVYNAINGSAATVDTWAGTQNSPHITTFAAGYMPRSPGFVLAAITAAIDTDMDDGFAPRSGLPLTGFVPPLQTNDYSSAEREIHLRKGLATFTISSDGSARIQRLVTNYKTNGAGAVDPSYRDTETLRGLIQFGFDLNNRLGLRYQGKKLVNDGTKFTPGLPIVMPSTVKNEIIAFYGEQERSGNVQKPSEFTKSLIVMLNPDDPNRIDIVMQPTIANMLLSIAANLQFKLQ